MSWPAELVGPRPRRARRMRDYPLRRIRITGRSIWTAGLVVHTLACGHERTCRASCAAGAHRCDTCPTRAAADVARERDRFRRRRRSTSRIVEPLELPGDLRNTGTQPSE